MKLLQPFIFGGTVNRAGYVRWGVALAALKFLFDALVHQPVFGRPWSPWDYLVPGAGLPSGILQQPGFLLLVAWGLLSAVFAWVGMALTVKRLRDLGWHLAWSLLFFVPLLKLGLFTALCLVPGRQERRQQPHPARTACPRLRRGILRNSGKLAVSLVATVGMAAAFVLLATSVLSEYGWAVFVVLPAAMGFTAVILYARGDRVPLSEAQVVAMLSMAMAGLGLLLFAMEGLICLIMAAPLAAALAAIGAALAWQVLETLADGGERRAALVLALFLPAGGVFAEHVAGQHAPLLEVTTSVVVAAPPETVWRHVVSFSDLPPPSELLFRAGIAYPVRARIEGAGVGAVRHCEFSTGAFVEPITEWEAPWRLGFAVTHNPPPMEEWTPYRSVHPPHLDGFLVSRRGEFRLEPLPGGCTRLQGTTWYQHHMWPVGYWQLWSDGIIHAIHRRVLNHISNLAEAEQGSR